MPSDNRKPKLKKIGCWFCQNKISGFHFFDCGTEILDGDFFVYNKGILFKENKHRN